MSLIYILKYKNVFFLEGQCFLAIDPSVFAPGFDKRLDELLNLHRNQPLSDPEKPILIAGDPERLHMKKCSELGGVPYPSQVVDYMVDLLFVSNKE